MRLALAYLLAINLAAFAAFAVDKLRAERGLWRVRERTLLGLTAAGGGLGAAAAQGLLRHKTQKEPFRSQLALLVAAQAILLPLAVYLAR